LAEVRRASLRHHPHRSITCPEIRRRRGDTLKVLWSTGDGLCLLAKRLETGRFVWPQADGGKIYLTHAQLSMLLEGIDWRAPRRTNKVVTML